jgi:uncharacterized protein
MVKMILIYSIVAVLFLAIYSLAHYYLYLKLEKLFGINKIALVIILAALALSFPLISLLERKLQGSIIKAVYFMSATWLGIIFFLVLGFLIADLVILISKINYEIPYYIVLTAIAFIAIISLISAQIIHVNKINIPANISEDLKIVQISDVHLGTIYSKNYLNKIIEKSNYLNPDIVVITGDLFDGSAPVSKETISSLDSLKSKQGVYFITGNHETYIDEEKALKLINSENVTILRNEKKELPRIQIIGADYPLKESEKNNSFLDELPNLVDKNKFSIFLYHPPVGFEKAADAGINLQLSGHTHNGQIFPFSLILRIFYKYEVGLYKLRNSYLYVSEGSGTWGPPMRFLSNTEITEINLVKK